VGLNSRPVIVGVFKWIYKTYKFTLYDLVIYILNSEQGVRHTGPNPFNYGAVQYTMIVVSKYSYMYMVSCLQYLGPSSDGRERYDQRRASRVGDSPKARYNNNTSRHERNSNNRSLLSKSFVFRLSFTSFVHSHPVPALLEYQKTKQGEHSSRSFSISIPLFRHSVR